MRQQPQYDDSRRGRGRLYRSKHVYSARGRVRSRSSCGGKAALNWWWGVVGLPKDWEAQMYHKFLRRAPERAAVHAPMAPESASPLDDCDCRSTLCGCASLGHGWAQASVIFRPSANMQAEDRTCNHEPGTHPSSSSSSSVAYSDSDSQSDSYSSSPLSSSSSTLLPSASFATSEVWATSPATDCHAAKLGQPTN